MSKTLKVSLITALISSIGSSIVLEIKEMPKREARCEAAQQTVMEETDLIAAAGKFPSEKTTNRWKALLEGC